MVLFDEPTSALDPEMVKEVLDVIGALAKATDVKVTTIRFYEQSGLLPAPPRTASASTSSTVRTPRAGRSKG